MIQVYYKNTVAKSIVRQKSGPDPEGENPDFRVRRKMAKSHVDA